MITDGIKSAILELPRISEYFSSRKLVPSTPRLSFWTVGFRHNPGGVWWSRHSRPQSPRFFWSRGQRNGGLWTQPIPDVRNFLTSVSACVVAFNATAHAHMLILREGEGREFIFMADRGKTSTKRSKESLIFIYAERSRIKAI